MKELKLELDASAYVAQLEAISEGYEKLSKSMTNTAKSASATVSTTRTLEDSQKKLIDLENKSIQLAGDLEKAKNKLAKSRSPEGKAAYQTVKATQAETTAIQDSIKAKKLDAAATEANIKAELARVATIKALQLQIEKDKATSAANTVSTTGSNATAASTNAQAAAQRLTNTQLLGVAQVQNANNIASARIQTQQAQQQVFAGRAANAQISSIAAVSRAQAKANQTALQSAGIYQQRLNTIGAQQQKIAAQTSLIHTRQAAVLAKQNAQVQKQLISWQNIQRVIVGQLTFRAVTLGVHEIQAAYETAKQYTTAIAQIQTISQTANISSRQWAEGLRAVSDATGFSAIDVAKSAYQSLSNQVTKGGETFQFLQSAAGLAKAGVTDLSTSIDIITSALNSYNLGVESAEEVSAAYFKTIELGRVKAEDLKSVMGTLEVFGAQLGITFQELGATIATMTNQGITATKAGTQLRSLLTTLIKPTEDLKKLYTEWGVTTGEAAIATFGWDGVLARLAQTTKGSTDELGRLIHNQRALIGAMVLTGPALDVYRANLDDIKNSSESYAEAQRIVAESASEVILKATNRFSNFFLEIGESSVQGFAKIIKTMDSFNATFEGIFVGGAVVAGGAALLKLGSIATLVATDFAALATAVRVSSLSSVVSIKLMTAAQIQAATATELAAARGKAALIATGWGAALIAVGLVVERIYDLAHASDEVTDKIKKANEEWLESTTRTVRQSSRLFDQAIKDITDNAARRSRLVRLSANEAYKKSISGFKKITTSLNEELTDTVSNYRRSLDAVVKATDLAVKQSSNSLSQQIGIEAQQLAIALGKIRGEGADVKRAKELAKIEIERGKVVRDYDLQRSALHLAQRAATKAADRERLADINKQRVADAKTYNEKLAAIDLEKKELAEKAAEEAKVIKATANNALRIRSTLGEINEADKAGLEALKLRTSQYEGATEALAQQLISAGKYAEAEQLVQVVTKDREALFLRIAKAESDIADKQAQDTIDREAKLTAARVAGEQLLTAAKLNNKLIEDDDYSKRKERLTELLRLYEDIANNDKIAGAAAKLPTQTLPEDIARTKVSIAEQDRALAQDKKDAELAKGIQALKDDLSAALGGFERAKNVQEDLTKEITQRAKVLERVKDIGDTRGVIRKPLEDFFTPKGPVNRVATAGTKVTAKDVADALRSSRETKGLVQGLPPDQRKLLGVTDEDFAALDRSIKATLSVAQAQLKGADLAVKLTEQAVKLNEAQPKIKVEELALLRDQTTALQDVVKILSGNGYANGGAVKYFAKGGGPKGTDTVPAWLTPGEFVVNRSATARNRALLESINSNNFAGTSRPMSSPRYYAEGGSVSNTSVGNISITMAPSGNTSVDVLAIGQQLQREIRRGRISFA